MDVTEIAYDRPSKRLICFLSMLLYKLNVLLILFNFLR